MEDSFSRDRTYPENAMLLPISIPQSHLDRFCQQNHIRKFSFFGSILREDFSDRSDIDVLVEFHPEGIPGFIKLMQMQQELTDLFGRQVDLRTPNAISPYIRDRILQEALVQYCDPDS